ncbi:serine/threonine-protein phosphatase 2A activator isoform X1 [Carlito syrichta]|uniref:Serine/threonine-protein phosphatase 2A activator n=1 Tax=Carlito syrichta TaxID=1868482 RepID=A0A1U7U8F5_CARSF|nr:serine/threonine-protein phosphatase 2A activator isoform X1 [Carlito syrichta]
MGKWKRSQAYADYIGFILTLNEGVKGKKLTVTHRVSEAIEKLVALLNTLDRWIDETPPVDQPSRFGNKAYRTWYAKLDQEAENLVATVVPPHLAAAVPEVAVYLKESVGNATRIDYGTGHEAAFAAFLCCLCKIGVLRVDDQIAIVFKVFNRYLEVMRKLQKTYRMEPAGSQGVWGLDDFQFLPFIWGSSQLIDEDWSVRGTLQPAVEHQRCPLLVQSEPGSRPHVQGRVPGEVPGDPALQVRELAAHPSCHLRLRGPLKPPPPAVPVLTLPLFFLFDGRLLTRVGWGWRELGQREGRPKQGK